MSKRVLAVLLAFAFIPVAAAAATATPFVGQWKLDPARTRLPDQMKVEAKGGQTYVFDFGAGPETIVVDGRYQPGEGGTLLSVKPEAPRRWTVQRKKDGRLMITAHWTLAKDGRTITDDIRQFTPAGATQISMLYVYRRAGPGTGFAGGWQSIKETVTSPVAMQVSAFDGDGLAFVNTMTQVTKKLRFDGRDYPVETTPPRPGVTASIRREGPQRLVITDKAAGKVTVTEDVTLSPDLKTLTITQHITGAPKPNVLVYGRG